MAFGGDDFSGNGSDQRAVSLFEDAAFDLAPLNELLDENLLIMPEPFGQSGPKLLCRLSLADADR